MTSAVLGERLGMTASGARKLEQAEAADAITLSTLRRVAEALDCELQYAIVPRRPLRQMRWKQALRLAEQWQQRSSRTMALEAQPIASPSAAADKRLKALAEEILRTSGTRLWD
jgi:predicted DNA-binding mobile mystery protein A